MNQIFDRKFQIENIEQAMWKRALDLWGYRTTTSIEAFDPIVKLLIGAQAVGIKNIHDEIESTEHRILKKLAQLMLPEIVTTPIPASSILCIQPYDPFFLISPEFQATCLVMESEIPFSPAGYYQILDAKIEHCFLLLSNSLINITEHTNFKGTPADYDIMDLKRKEQFQISHTRTLFIGLEIDESISKLDKLSFYFNWSNIPNKLNEEYCRLLQSTQWFMNHQPVKTFSGLPCTKAAEENEFLNEIETLFDIAAVLENQVNSLYKHHFITIQLPPHFHTGKKTCPDSIKNLIQNQNISFSKPLLWLEVHFPAMFSDELLKNNLMMLVNCVPVMNRRLNTIRYVLNNQKMNIIPLKTDEKFLAIKDVRDSNGKVYRNVPNLMKSENYAGLYYLRHEGVNRVDSRQASELLQNLFELVRDESASFSAFNPDEMLTELKELHQIVNRLEMKMNRFQLNKDSIWYLILDPVNKKNNHYEEISIQFWTTNGKEGNDIPAGDINRFSSMSFGPAINQVSNIVTTAHGKDHLNETDMLNAYRNTILTRRRIVTPEDIKSVCREYLGSQVQDVEVKKSVMFDLAPKEGLKRCIDVLLTPASSCKLDNAGWEKISNELQIILEGQWMSGWPLRIKIQSITKEA